MLASRFLAFHFLQVGVITSLYCLAILGYGQAASRRFIQLTGSFTDFVATRLVTGCAILYAAFIALSLGTALRPPFVAALLVVGLAFAVIHGKEIVTELRLTVNSIKERGETKLVWLVAGLTLAQLTFALTPLTFYDSQVYQLLAPVQFLRAGKLVEIPWSVLTNGPMALQLTLGMSWIADPTGTVFKLLIAAFGSLSIVAAMRIGSEFGFRSALVAALFVVAYPEFWIQQTLGAVDLAAGAFLLFGAVWWIESLRTQNWRWTVLAGIAFGIAVASRYQAIVLAAWLVIGVLAAEYFRKQRIQREDLLRCALIIVTIALMVSPWLIRNYFHFGNPVYPLMHQIWGTPEWSPAQAAQLQAEVMGTPFSQLSPSQAAMGPLGILLMMPGNGLFGLGLLLGCLIAVSSKGQTGRLFAVLGIGGLIIWGVIHPMPGVQLMRFNAATLVLMLATTGAILGGDVFRGVRGTAVAMAIALGSLIIALIAVHNVVPVWQTLTSAAARTEYSHANIPSWQVLQFANEKLDPAAHKILLIGETRAVWLTVPFLAPSAFNGPQLQQVFASSESSDWYAALRQLGITHILICSSEWQRLADAYGYFRLADDQLKRLNTWFHTLPVRFDDGRGNVLLEVR